MAFVADDMIWIYAATMITRTLSPVIKSGWEYITGKEKKDEDRRKGIEQEKRDAAIELQNLSHRQRLEAAQKQFELNLQDWATKTYYKECWPLRNPFEMQYCVKPVSDSSNVLGDCVIPCRIIMALPDNSHPLAKTINGNLSSFLVNYYSSNSLHSVVSDIGAWRDDIPVNDASINYLYAGLKGQPVMIITPTLINNGTTIIFKMWSWGLGEGLNYPAGYEFGRLELRPLYQQSIYEESKRMISLAAKMGYKPSEVYSQQLRHNISIIKNLDDKKLSGEFENQMLYYLVDAKEIEDSVRVIMGQKVSGLFCCVAGMYADAYHLIEYRTLPKLPSLLPKLPGIEFVSSAIKSYYLELLKEVSKIETNKDLLSRIYLDVADAFSRLDFSFELRESIIEPFAKEGLKLFVESSEGDDDDDLSTLPVIRHVIKSDHEMRSSELVKYANEIFTRAKMDTI